MRLMWKHSAIPPDQNAGGATKRCQISLDYQHSNPRSFSASLRNESDYDPMSPTVREKLESYFEPHNLMIFSYLGTDFDWRMQVRGTCKVRTLARAFGSARLSN